MSKYGLQLRASSSAKPPRAKAAAPVPSLFRDDDDEESIERELARQAAKQRSVRQAEEQQRRALEQDPNVFDYDSFYDDMQQTQGRFGQRPREVKREARYIPGLMQKARFREQEQDVAYENKLAKERAAEDQVYKDKESFVTPAYKRKLEEQNKWLRDEKMRQLREQEEEVTKRADLSDFYRNLTRNVAFGGGGDDDEHRKPTTAGAAAPGGGGDKAAASYANGGANGDDSKSEGEGEGRQEDAGQQQQQEEEDTKDGEVKKAEVLNTEEAKREREESARERYLSRKKLKQSSGS